MVFQMRPELKHPKLVRISYGAKSAVVSQVGAGE
jgi:hypothetical protein